MPVGTHVFFLFFLHMNFLPINSSPVCSTSVKLFTVHYIVFSKSRFMFLQQQNSNSDSRVTKDFIW